MGEPKARAAQPSTFVGSAPLVASRRRRDPRVAIGALLVVAGLTAAGLAVWAAVVDEGPLPVGRLVASDVPSAGEPPAGGGTDAPGIAGAPSDRPSWPPAVQGRPPAFGTDGDGPPASADGLEDGWYLWSDFAGWHLWLVGDDRGGSVEVTTNASFLADPTGGQPALETGEQRLTLARGEATEPVVGVDFNPGFFAKELVVTVTGDLPLRTGFGLVDAASPLVLRYEPQG